MQLDSGTIRVILLKWMVSVARRWVILWAKMMGAGIFILQPHPIETLVKEVQEEAEQ